jgi:hypothetical protein
VTILEHQLRDESFRGFIVKKSIPHLSVMVRCICACFGTAVPLMGNAAENWDIGYQPHVELGVADYNLEFSSVSQIVPGGSGFSAGKVAFGATMPTLSAGLTLFAERYFLDMSVQRMQTYNQSMGDSHTIISSTPSMLTTGQISYETDDFNRDEYTLSLGYGLTESVSVYLGYKKQYSNLNQLQGAGPVGIQFANGNLIPANFATFGDYKFDYDGPFVGGTTTWKMGNDTLKGRLAFSAGVAFLHGSLHIQSEGTSLTTNDGSPLPATVKASDLFDTSGDAVGITLGASWLGQTGIANLSYSVAVNGYKYDFDADEQDRADSSEDVLQLKVGLAFAL